MNADAGLSPRHTSESAERLAPTHGSTAAAAQRRVGAATSRIRRAVHEFLLLPALVVMAYAALGLLSIALDKNTPQWLSPAQHAIANVVSRKAAGDLLSGIATSVVTVTSITFSVLLLAVQQTASAMTPAVFDQFLRRRTNQFYLGMFVGLSLYSFLVLASIGPKASPAFGAAIALGLTVISFGVLVVLIYSTVDQMRPASVTQVIHDRALEARVSELGLLRATRRESRGCGPVRVAVHAEQDGYATGLDVESVVEAMPDAPGAEVVLAVTLGDHVAFGQQLATVIDDDEASSEHVAEAVRKAVHLDRARDLAVDASFAVEQLGNIAWTALSTAKQNPQTGREAVDRLRDLGARWSLRDAMALEDDRAAPVVYEDRDLDHLLDTLLACLVVCSESQQVASSAHTIHAIADVLGAAPDGALERFEPALRRSLGVVSVHPMTRPLAAALGSLANCLETRGCGTTAELARQLLRSNSTVPGDDEGPVRGRPKRAPDSQT